MTYLRKDAGTDILSDLTPAQQEAVTHGEGPLLVLAGAGSGKTRVITRRIIHLLQEGIRPYHILAITFTNKAAGEMKQRVEAILPKSRVWISTFHSMGVRLLRQYGDRFGLDRNFTIYDQQDRSKVVKAAIAAADIDNVRFTPDTIMGAISRAKNQLLTPPQYEARAKDFFSRAVAHVYPVYERKLREANALDFDDLLYLLALGLKEDPEFRAELDSRFRYILIDEYQDTNKAQYSIVRAISMDEPNLCVVGDPDQSIYKFRGSDIRNILDFEKDFPQAKIIPLEQNYRSTKSILRAASHIIAHNEKRKPKDLVTENAEGKPVSVLYFGDGIEEAEGIALRIRDAVEKGNRRYRDHAIFLRTNALSRSLESAFINKKVPYQMVRGLAFYDRKENRDVLAYLRLLVNYRDDISFLRIVNEPGRGIGKVSLQRLQEYAEPREMCLLSAAAQADLIETIKGKAGKGLKEFAQLMGNLQQFIDAPPDEVIRQVIQQSGYRRMLKESHDPDDEERLANIEELITAASQFAEEDPERTMADFLENITLASDVDAYDDDQDCVAVMTLHSSKGLEFPVIYILAMEQGLLPHERSLNNKDDIEEERRLAFVGMTRAKEELNLCHAHVREFRGQMLYQVPSMFLEELPHEGVVEEDLSEEGFNRKKLADSFRGGNGPAAEGWREAGFTIQPASTLQSPSSKKPSIKNSLPGKADFAEGMTVNHENYGDGKVISISGVGAKQKVKVRFSSVGERTFIAQLARLKIIR